MKQTPILRLVVFLVRLEFPVDLLYIRVELITPKLRELKTKASVIFFIVSFCFESFSDLRTQRDQKLGKLVK